MSLWDDLAIFLIEYVAPLAACVGMAAFTLAAVATSAAIWPAI